LSRAIVSGDSHGGGDQSFFDEFIDCITQGRKPIADLEAGLESNVLAHCIDQALMTKSVVSV